MITGRTNNYSYRINLDGPDGNAFVLFGIIRNLVGKENAREITEELQKGSYIDILCYLEENYGDILILETDNEDLVEEMRINADKKYEHD